MSMPQAPKQLNKPRRPSKRSHYGRDWEKLVRRLRVERTLVAAAQGVSMCIHCAKEGITFKPPKPRELHADHILPVSMHPHLRLVENNVQFLCRRHHTLKTMTAG